MIDIKLLREHMRNSPVQLKEQEAPADPAMGIGDMKKRPSVMDYARKLLKTKRGETDHLDPNYVPPGKRPSEPHGGRYVMPADPERKLYKPKFDRKGDKVRSIPGADHLPTDDREASRRILYRKTDIIGQKAETDAKKKMRNLGGPGMEARPF